MGMEIANHSKTHGSMTNMTPDEIRAEIDYVDEKVEAITGEKTKCFRPPFIGVSQTMYDTIDMPFIYGADTQDYKAEVDADERAEAILKNAKDGTIYLMHDFTGNDQTVEALKIALPKLVEQGYEFVTISELFERQGEAPKKNILYSSVAKYPCKGYSLYQEIDSGNDKILLDIDTLKKLGDKAVFLASDILSAFDELGIGYSDIDGISISPYGGTLTASDIKLLVKSGSKESVQGDVNADGEFNVSDLVMLQK